MIAKDKIHPPYQKSVDLTAPHSTHVFHEEDVTLARNLHQKSKPVAQIAAIKGFQVAQLGLKGIQK